MKKRGEKLKLKFRTRKERSSKEEQQWVVCTAQSGVEIFDEGSESWSIRREITLEEVHRRLEGRRQWVFFPVDSTSSVFVIREDLVAIKEYLLRK